MSTQSLARQYANAAYDVARRNDVVEAVGRDLADLAAIISTHPDLEAVFATPLVTPAKKRALVEALANASQGLTDEARRLLLLLADRNRLTLVRDVAAAYADRCMRASKAVAADVTTAVPLGDPEKRALEAALGTATGQTVTVTHHVDPSIIGGLVARVGSLVFDSSVTRQMERLRQRLLADA
ncbi:MAG: ATP synthase F1 subunit delta [Vicinamibacterales bacterium]